MSAAGSSLRCVALESAAQRRQLARGAVVAALAVLQIACSSTAVVFADPYAHCEYLGDLSVLSSNRPDAEQRLAARVTALGGDTLLFGYRGRSEPLSELPDELVERRDGLVTFAEPNSYQALVETISSDESQDSVEDATELTSPGRNGDQPRNPRISWQEVPPAQGELWYYGAALRCGIAQ
jgi:hypothetical protein